MKPKKKNSFFKQALAFVLMPTFITSIIMLSGAIILILISKALFLEHPWISNVMISASCGIITGLALYFLTNLRSNSYNKLKNEYNLLIEVRNESANIVRDSKYYLECHCLWNREIETDEFFKTIYEGTEKVQGVLMDKISWELYREMGLEENDPIDYGFTDRLWKKYVETEDTDENIDELLNMVIESHERLIVLLKEPILKRKNKLSKYDKYNI